jgi:hypothetical protein
METLFRFTLLRKAHQTIDDTFRLDLQTDSAFQMQASRLPRNADWLRQLKQLASQYAESADFIRLYSQFPRAQGLQTLLNDIDRIIATAESSAEINLRDELAQYIGLRLEGDLHVWLTSDEVSTAERCVKDSILAIKLLPSLHALPIDRFANILRLLDLVRHFQHDSLFPETLAQLKGVRRQPLRLPEGFTPHGHNTGNSPDEDTTEEKLQDLAKKHQQLETAITELSALTPSAFQNTPLKSAPAQLPPQEFRPGAIFKDELQIRKLRLAELLKVVNFDDPKKLSALTTSSGNVGSWILGAEFNADFLAKEGANLAVSSGALLAMSGLPAFDAEALRNVMLLTTKARSEISASTKQLMQSFRLDLDQPLNATVSTLLQEKQNVAAEARQLLKPYGQTSIINMGSVRLIKRAMPIVGFLSLSPEVLSRMFPLGRVVTGSVPSTHSSIQSSGHTDLMIVKQQLVGYVTADIATIRSIMRGEFNEKVKRQLRLTEQEFYRETETTTETEHSVEVTDRFEMRKEVEETLKEELSAKGSLTISGTSGPQFEYRANAEVAWDKSAESTTRAATELAREVTEKASEKMIERVLVRQRTLIRTEDEATITQRLENKSEMHITGIYQWLNKVYEAQVFNYGMREVYDLMIPEPGAMLLAMFNRREAGVLDVEEVPALEIKPKDLNADNYQEFVRLYKATDVSPPPESFVTVSHNFHSGGDDKENARYVHSAKLSIPEGYQAFRASVGMAITLRDNWGVHVIIGQMLLAFSSTTPLVHITELNGETESIPVAMVSLSVADIGLALEVVCKATPRATELWQADTYEKIVNAYRSRKSEQEALLAERMMEAQFEVKGDSPAQNLSLIREELKRLCISTLTEQHFDHFKAVNTGVAGLPELDFGELRAEGAYVRFFEQAFEWENLTWITYPYFWGQKSQWENKILIEDTDPVYRDFLKAGYVRVVLPVRQNWNAAVDHFRMFGEPWLGGALPTVSDDLYLPIADELAERLNRPGKEYPVGDSWPVVVPTQLVTLRENASLPRWEKDERGVWVER